MAINWKEILAQAGLPLMEGVEVTVVDSSLDNFFVKNPEAYKKLVPVAHAALVALAPVFADHKVGAGLLAGFIAGIEQSAGECGVEL